MKLETKRVIFWIVALIVIVAFIAFFFLASWTAYNQLVQGLGQEPNLLGYFGYLFATGSSK